MQLLSRLGKRFALIGPDDASAMHFVLSPVRPFFDLFFRLSHASAWLARRGSIEKKGPRRTVPTYGYQRTRGRGRPYSIDNMWRSKASAWQDLPLQPGF